MGHRLLLAALTLSALAPMARALAATATFEQPAFVEAFVAPNPPPAENVSFLLAVRVSGSLPPGGWTVRVIQDPSRSSPLPSALFDGGSLLVTQ